MTKLQKGLMVASAFMALAGAGRVAMAVAPFFTNGAIPNYIRVGPVGDSWGPPSDMIQAEVVFTLAGDSKAYGINLTSDADSATHQAMFDLVRDGFTNGLKIGVDVMSPGSHTTNFMPTRVYLIR